MARDRKQIDINISPTEELGGEMNWLFCLSGKEVQK
jgi:hypothetical protein